MWEGPGHGGWFYPYASDLGCLRKVAGEDRGSKKVSTFPQWFLPLLLPKFLLTSLHDVVRKCKSNTSPQVAFDQHFIIATESQLEHLSETAYVRKYITRDVNCLYCDRLGNRGCHRMQGLVMYFLQIGPIS